jgi:hypothetical protein
MSSVAEKTRSYDVESINYIFHFRVSYAKLVSFPIEYILFVTNIRSVRKIGITGRMYLLIGERNTPYIEYSPGRSTCT